MLPKVQSRRVTFDIRSEGTTADARIPSRRLSRCVATTNDRSYSENGFKRSARSGWMGPGIFGETIRHAAGSSDDLGCRHTVWILRVLQSSDVMCIRYDRLRLRKRKSWSSTRAVIRPRKMREMRSLDRYTDMSSKVPGEMETEFDTTRVPLPKSNSGYICPTVGELPRRVSGACR